MSENTHVLTADGLDHIVRGGTEKLGDDGELVDMVLAGEEGLALEHFCEDAARTPDVDFDVVLLPREHDFRGTVVARGDVSGHLRILDPRQTKVADLQIAVFVDKDIAGFEVTVHHTGGMDIFQSSLSVRQKTCQREAPEHMDHRHTRIWYRKY